MQMPFILFSNKHISHLNKALSDILGNMLKKSWKLIITLIFVDFFQYINLLFPGGVYCPKIITAQVDNVRAFRIAKITYHPYINAVMEGQVFFVMEWHNFTLLQVTVSEALHYSYVFHTRKCNLSQPLDYQTLI